MNQNQIGCVQNRPEVKFEQIIGRALAAESDVASTPAYLRAEWLGNTANSVLQHQEALAKTIVQEGIKTIREARSEVGRAHVTLKLCAEQAKRNIGQMIPFDQAPRGVGRIGWTEMRPVGLVAAITPFNDPLNLVAHKVGPAIAAGCPVIVKPHEATPGSAIQLQKLFAQNGLPEGVFQVMEGKGAEIGKRLVEHPAVKMITFTGGVATGKAVAISSAGRPTSLEMGGICSTIVMPDADLQNAVENIVSGMFAAAGQNCLHVQRVLIDDAVYETVVQKLVVGTNEIQLGDPMSESTDMGNLIDEQSAKRCVGILDDALTRGGKIIAGGRCSGRSFQPTLLENVSKEARIYSEEVFGPITVIERFNGLEEAVTRLSKASASLAVAVFTKSLTLPFSLRQLRTGSIIINDSTDFRIDAMPFGGPFPAGLGREGVEYAIKSMSEPQLICLNLN
ncbi:MAG: aldehyde dehydrogenase family protein [Gammaproteobacteria bacterium]|nr:aldehyde dehydrogenase family protein [Gammaproteobacteria bacterium]